MTATAIASVTRRRHIRRGAGAAIAQGFYSLSNLVVGVAVARSLGPAALGHFAFLFTLLTAFVAVQTAWVGDSLTVLDRTDPTTKRGVATTQWAHCLLGGILGGCVAYLAGGVSPAGAIVFAGLVAAWELEEYGRRVFMARLEFWKQAANDLAYLLLVTVALLAYRELVGLTLTGALACMAAASLVAFALGVVALPAEERLGLPRLHGTGVREVGAFGIWRGAQSAAGYTSQVAVRSLVIVLASAATMGQLEAARLVIAPLFTVTAASANLSLAAFASSKDGPPLRVLAVALTAVGGVCAVYAAVVLAFPSFFVHLLAGQAFSAHRVELGGWLLLAAAVSVGTPLASLALVRRRAAPVFWARVGGSVAGLAVAAALLAASRPSLVPLALALGASVATVLLWPYAVAGKRSSPRLRPEEALS